MGKLKEEGIAKQHHIPCGNTTSSGIDVKARVIKLMEEKQKICLVQGPAISDSKGELITSVELDQMLNNLLENLYSQDSMLFPPDIRGLEDILASYHCLDCYDEQLIHRLWKRRLPKLIFIV